MTASRRRFTRCASSRRTVRCSSRNPKSPRLRRTPKTGEAWMKRRRIPFLKIGRTVLFNWPDLERHCATVSKSLLPLPTESCTREETTAAPCEQHGASGRATCPSQQRRRNGYTDERPPLQSNFWRLLAGKWRRHTLIPGSGKTWAGVLTPPRAWDSQGFLLTSRLKMRTRPRAPWNVSVECLLRRPA